MSHNDCEIFEEGLLNSQSKPNINFPNVGNIFPLGREAMLSHSDYNYITNDFYANHIDEEAVRICESFGFDKGNIINSIKGGDLNHAAATYYLLTS